MKGEPPVPDAELDPVVDEYRHVHEEHRRARGGGRVRRRLGARLLRVRGRFEHGGRPVARPHGPSAPVISLRGRVPDTARIHLEQMFERVARVSPRAIVHARASLVREEDPALDRPVVAKAKVDLAGRVVRAHVAAPSADEAIDLLESRLRRNLRDLAERDEGERQEGRAPEPHEWRHRDLPTARPGYFPRPAEERRLVRRKTFAAGPMTSEEAASEMLLLDHDFHLFTDAASGEDSLVQVGADGGFAVRRSGGPEPVPVCSVDEAVDRLDLTDAPLLFFVDAATGRGSVLYHRYDGHYGLVGAQHEGGADDIDTPTT